MKIVRGLFIVLSLCIISGCGSSANEEYEEIPIAAEEELADDELVATINGEEIDGETYNEMYLQVKTIAIRVEEKEDITEEELQKETVETLINNKLFLQLAEEKSIDIDRSSMEEDVKRLKKLDDEGYRELKNKFNYSDDGIVQQLRLEKARKAYIDEFITVDVSDEEVKQFYDETLEKSEEDLPDYESSYDRLKETLEINKAVEKVAEDIEAFKEKSTIDIHL